jgi:hypothetical protein
LTGSGIKDVKNALRAAARPPVTARPELSEVRKVLGL